MESEIVNPQNTWSHEMDTRLPNSVSTGGALTNVVDDAAKRVHAQIDTAASGTKARVDGVAQIAHGAVDATETASRTIAASADATLQRASGSITGVATSASATVRDNPLVALGGALAIGYLLGRLHR
jgi:ElaB/YqjD/DUF883 family membrane-anchored ribosome-binding protein